MKCHSCPLYSQHPSSPGRLVRISLLSANAVQLLWRRVLTESLLHALPFCTTYGAQYRPDTQRSRRRQSHNVQGILYSSSWHFLVVVFNSSFSSHRSLENFLQTGQLLHCCYVCLSLPGSKLLGGEDFPHGHPRQILACWGHDHLQASGLQRHLPHLPSSSACPVCGGLAC